MSSDFLQIDEADVGASHQKRRQAAEPEVLQIQSFNQLSSVSKQSSISHPHNGYSVQTSISLPILSTGTSNPTTL
jgi:hypothetical protein